MIIAIVKDGSTAETLLNNLSEADFSLADISLVMSNMKQRNAIADDVGPLKGVTPQNLMAALTHAGLSPQDAKPYVDAVAHGQVLVAMNAPASAQAAAMEMLKDHSAQLIRG